MHTGHIEPDCPICPRLNLPGYEAVRASLGVKPTLALAPIARPIVRNLLYHIWPHHGPIWRWNVEQIRQRLFLFNGKRVVAIVTDAGTDSADEVKRAFGDGIDEFIVLPNDSSLREVRTHHDLWSRVESTNPSYVTFYAHAKGVSDLRRGSEAVRRWTEILYAANLDHWDAVEAVLDRHPVAGCFKKLGQGWGKTDWPEAHLSQWHYSGSFYWVRDHELFSRSDWSSSVPCFWSGVEPWLSLLFSAAEAGVVFWESPLINLYDSAIIREKILPAWRDWQGKRTVQREAKMVSTRIRHKAGLKVELGGGSTPLGGEWVNVDAQDIPGVHHVVDFEAADLRLPFADGSVDGLYTSHTLEHIRNLKGLLHEIVRICRVGASVEFRVPHALSAMALCHDHVQVIPPEQVEHWCATALDYWWKGSAKRLKHVRTEQIPGGKFEEAAQLFPHLTREQVMSYIPGAAHEYRYMMEVVPYAE